MDSNFMNREDVQSGVPTQPWQAWLTKAVDNIPNMSEAELKEQPWRTWRPEAGRVYQGTEKPWNRWLTADSTKELCPGGSTGSG
jgi:hypothetical protein